MAPRVSYATYAVPLPRTGLRKSLPRTGDQSSPPPRPGISFTDGACTTGGFPHSNCRAEIGVKRMKRLITDNTGPKGELDTDAVQRAILQYRNTPDPDTKLYPVMCVFGRPICDFIPIAPGRYR